MLSCFPITRELVLWVVLALAGAAWHISFYAKLLPYKRGLKRGKKLDMIFDFVSRPTREIYRKDSYEAGGHRYLPWLVVTAFFAWATMALAFFSVTFTCSL
jgi:hypothetical protein